MPRVKPPYRPTPPAPAAIRTVRPVPRPRPDTRTNHRNRHTESRGAGTTRTRSDLTRTSTAREPELTGDLAYAFVQLLHAGLSGPDALAYCAPEYRGALAEDTKHGASRLAAWLTKWSRDRLTLAAATRLNHGEWHQLEPDARLAIALDKHYAELAYFLYTHDWASLDGTDLRKATDAREALTKKLEGTDAADDSPMVAFLRALQEGTVRQDKPVQLVDLTLPQARTAEAAAARADAGFIAKTPVGARPNRPNTYAKTKASTRTDLDVKLTKGES